MRKFFVKVNGIQYEVEVEEVNAQEKASAPARAAASAAAPASEAVANVGENIITAPMPGTIIKVNVSVGDVVTKGQVLLVLEAMKMENEIVAPSDGKVTAVNVEKGNSVNAGDVLVQLG